MCIFINKPKETKIVRYINGFCVLRKLVLILINYTSNLYLSISQCELKY